MSLATPDLAPRPLSTPPSLLVVILDLHPLSWSLLASASTDNLGHEPTSSEPTIPSSKPPLDLISLTEFVTILMVFLNAHLVSRWANEVVVYGAVGGRS